MLIDPRNSKQQDCNTLTPWHNSCCSLAFSSPCLTFALHSGLAGRLGSGLFLRLFREEVPSAWGVCQASKP